MKKKKRTVPRFSIAAGLTWRMGVLVGALWLTAMSLLTVICAQQLQEKWTQHTAGITAFSVPERDDLLPGEIERSFIHKMYGFDLASDVYLDLPLYKDPTLNRPTYKPRNDAHETAMVLCKDGVPMITPGEYVTFEYLHEDSWLEGKETADGYGYLALEDLRIPLSSYTIATLSGFLLRTPTHTSRSAFPLSLPTFLPDSRLPLCLFSFPSATSLTFSQAYH